MPGRTPLHLPALSATVLRPAFLPPNQECSTDSSGLPDPLPPSDDPDWGQLCFPCDFLLPSSTPPAHSVFPSTFPGLPQVLLSHLAAPDLALSSASSLVHSAAKTCYASSRSISFFMGLHVECVDHRLLNAIRDRGSTFSSHLITTVRN